MIILVCGGRDFDNYQFIRDKLIDYIESFGDKYKTEKDQYGNYLYKDVTILTGGAKGADQCGSDFAVENFIHFIEINADWEFYGRSAGPIRNQKMLDEHEVNVVMAFPGGRGTIDMVSRARKAGVNVLQYHSQDVLEWENDRKRNI